MGMLISHSSSWICDGSLMRRYERGIDISQSRGDTEIHQNEIDTVIVNGAGRWRRGLCPDLLTGTQHRYPPDVGWALVNDGST